LFVVSVEPGSVFFGCCVPHLNRLFFPYPSMLFSAPPPFGGAIVQTDSHWHAARKLLVQKELGGSQKRRNVKIFCSGELLSKGFALGVIPRREDGAESRSAAQSRAVILSAAKDLKMRRPAPLAAVVAF
jgi:hypothetical protein